MIFIVVKFQVKPEHAEKWPAITAEFTEATRAEPGNKWFQWSRSVEDPNEYVLIEAFDDDAAGPHVESAHFQRAVSSDGAMAAALVSTPKIISRQIEGEDWEEMGEMKIN
ncbi:antibiotic biosynthesis monooxygenase [Nesterenkonia sp. LB17]|uniref:putative quinol monooxygenase n=1 Tax=unclassified Nesterenkonia TaxID=2629769 RepID=UPI001F4D16E2|nr:MULTISPECIES: putative quinol monooxygenase [unclassified Nesterenkonia]MCH8561187.1 antibiotic biosynthesis monooxygenase [Nesterenkonia sp. DZ6]MCH8565436.1 antibiotic biosynthesis monooxygenase [Nesterenkonia sp. LB17]MCH8571347.1 antibiotic biosynthesis monooxygenase [Nesterenkonia sp. AY15]